MNRYQTYRLHPKTEKNHNLLHQIAGANRFVWNHFLDKNIVQMEILSRKEKGDKPSVSFYSKGKGLHKVKKGNGVVI